MKTYKQALQFAKDYADDGVASFSSYIMHNSCNLTEYEWGYILQFDLSIPNSFLEEEIKYTFNFHNPASNPGAFFSFGDCSIIQSNNQHEVSVYIRAGYDI